MGADAEQAQLEYLKQATRARANDDDLGRNFVQNSLFRLRFGDAHL